MTNSPVLGPSSSVPAVRPVPVGIEDWRPGDIVLDAGGALWTRSSDPEWPWAYDGRTEYGAPEGAVEESMPQRPLTLLVRDGLAVRTMLLRSDGGAAYDGESDATAPAGPEPQVAPALRGEIHGAVRAALRHHQLDGPAAGAVLQIAARAAASTWAAGGNHVTTPAFLHLLGEIGADLHTVPAANAPTPKASH